METEDNNNNKENLIRDKSPETVKLETIKNELSNNNNNISINIHLEIYANRFSSTTDLIQKQKLLLQKADEKNTLYNRCCKGGE